MTKPKKTKPTWAEAADSAIALNLLHQMGKDLRNILEALQAVGPEYEKIGTKQELCADRRQEKAEERANARMREDTAAKIFAALVTSGWKPDTDGASYNERFLENKRIAQAVSLTDRLRESLAGVADPYQRPQPIITGPVPGLVQGLANFPEGVDRKGTEP